MRISYWSSDVCSSYLISLADYIAAMQPGQEAIYTISGDDPASLAKSPQLEGFAAKGVEVLLMSDAVDDFWRSEEHTSELQSLMRISYAVFCLKKKKTETTTVQQS